MTEGERGLEALFTLNKVNYKPKQRIHAGVNTTSNRYVYAIPDFYLPDYKGYCEVISSKQSLDVRYSKLKYCINKGYKFTFYDGKGRKLMFTKKTLGYIGLKYNSELFVIKELDYGLATLSGTEFICSALYPEYIPPIILSQACLQKRKQLKEKVILLYTVEGWLQKDIAAELNISQTLVSKLYQEVLTKKGGESHE
jgi:hypothetical protein